MKMELAKIPDAIIPFSQDKAYDLTILNVIELLRNLLQLALIMAGGAALIFLIIGGIRYITSGGAEEQVAAARKTMTYAILGIIIIGLSYAIISFLWSQISTQAVPFVP